MKEIGFSSSQKISDQPQKLYWRPLNFVLFYGFDQRFER